MNLYIKVLYPVITEFEESNKSIEENIEYTKGRTINFK